MGVLLNMGRAIFDIRWACSAPCSRRARALERSAMDKVPFGDIAALFFGREPAQYVVAVRMPAETRDHVAMAARLRGGEFINPAQMGGRFLRHAFRQMRAPFVQIELFRVAE